MNSPAEKKRCFVIGPIGRPGDEERRHADWLLDGIIKPAFETFKDFTVRRADEIVGPGSINSQVINQLWDADLVIADMSFHNANAFYELAIAHMRHRPTILMIREDFDIPFDVAAFRAVVFSTGEYKDLIQAQRDLADAVSEAIKLESVENPVTHARGAFEIAEKGDPAIQVVTTELLSLRREVEQIRSRLRSIGRSGQPVNALLPSPPPTAISTLADFLLGGSPTVEQLKILGELAKTISREKREKAD